MENWEEELDRRLKALPELEAPNGFAENVMRAVNERESAASHSRSWILWPKGLKVGGMAAVASAAAIVVWMGSQVEWVRYLNDIVISNTGGFSAYLAGVVGLWAALVFLYASNAASGGVPVRSVTPGAMVDSLDLSISGEPAGLFSRTGALALDFLIVSTCIGVKDTLSILNSVDLEFYFLFSWALYHLVFWRWKGATLGDLALRLRVERVDGRRLTLADCSVRGLASLVSALPFGLGFWWAGWDANAQSWHDKASDTVITRQPKRRLLF